MSALPSGWRLEALGDIASDVRQSVTAVRVAAYELWSVPAFADQQPELVNGSEIGSAKRLVQPGDVLLCKINPRINRVWLVGAHPDGRQQIASPEWLILRTHEVLPQYLRLYLSSPAFRDWIVTAVSGVTGSHTRAKAGQILQQLVPVPPFDEQRRIVEILEDHLSRLDAATDGLSSADRRLTVLKSSRAEWAKQTALSAGNPVSLATLALDSGYGTSTKCVAGGCGPAVVRIPNLVNGRVDLMDEKRVEDSSIDVSSAMLSEDDLLIVRTNGSRQLVGRTAVVQSGIDAAFASYLIRYRLDAMRVRADWVQLMMQAPSTRAVLESMAASSAGQYNLGLTKLNTLGIPVPELTTQDRLIASCRGVAEAADRASVEVNRTNARGLVLRRALLTAAFSGRLA